MPQFSGFEWGFLFQLFLALLLGGLIGMEREYKKKEAGLRTYALVAFGAALFTMVSLRALGMFSGLAGTRLDFGNVIGAVSIGLGFIGAGLIIYRAPHVAGLTTAAGIWATGAIGVAIGLGFYSIATFATLLALFVLSVLGIFERKFMRKGSGEENGNGMS